jgi:hypothetical protein
MVNNFYICETITIQRPTKNTGNSTKIGRKRVMLNGRKLDPSLQNHSRITSLFVGWSDMLHEYLNTDPIHKVFV